MQRENQKQFYSGAMLIECQGGEDVRMGGDETCMIEKTNGDEKYQLAKDNKETQR